MLRAPHAWDAQLALEVLWHCPILVELNFGAHELSLGWNGEGLAQPERLSDEVSLDLIFHGFRYGHDLRGWYVSLIARIEVGLDEVRVVLGVDFLLGDLHLDLVVVGLLEKVHEVLFVERLL